MSASDVVMDIPRRYQRKVQPFGELSQSCNPTGVTLNEVVLDFDECVALSEYFREVLCRFFRFGVAFAVDQTGKLARAAAAENDQSSSVCREVGWVERWRSGIVGGQVCRRRLPGAGSLMRSGHQAAQVGVTLLALGEQCQVDGPA